MKVAILGTRGIPNHYGGFEQFAEFFSVFLTEKGHEVYVYNSHTHPYKEKSYRNVNIIHCYDPEYKIGTAGQFIYDLNCILDSRKRKFDIILQLGYTSNSIWHWLLPKKPLIITNMDGLEWKRTKYSNKVQTMLKYAENLAVKSSDVLIADSVGIQTYLKEKYNKNSVYIAYGATLFDNPDESILTTYGLVKEKYNMLIARLEPENSIEVILDGAANSESKIPFLVIGSYKNAYGSRLKEKYAKYHHIKFFGPLYNLAHLNNLRWFSSLYFHGHTVGGTNPSLLEAMASGALIIANNNIFNKSILKENAFYFEDSNEVAHLIATVKKSDNLQRISNNSTLIQKDFSWDTINGKYLSLFEESLASRL